MGSTVDVTNQGQFEIREEEDAYIPASQFNEASGLVLHNTKKFEVEFPSPTNGNRYRIRSKGWVGTIPLPGKRTLRVKPKTPVRNAFSMLEAAYDLKPLQLFDGQVSIESVEDATEILAGVFARRVLDRIRKGLYGGYVEFSERLASVRGRIDINETVRSFTQSASINCDFQEFTRDVEENRILLWTLNVLPRFDLKSASTRIAVRQARNALLHSVALEGKAAAQCEGRSYNRLNEDYRLLHGICRFFLDNVGPGLRAGDSEFIPFLLNMPLLFESFVARWLSTNLPIGFTAKAQYSAKLDSESDLRFRIDIVLENRGRPIAVLDTKYKLRNSRSAEDVQAVIAYAVRMGTRSAFLIYPTSVGLPPKIQVGNITVDSVAFDLSGNLNLGGVAFLKNVLSRCLPNDI